MRKEELDEIPDGLTALAQARRAMRTGGSSEKGPQMGSRWPIGGVALEITQRCNLYANTQIPSDYQVEFIDYDWTVNVQHRDKVGSSFRGFYEPP